MVNSQPVAGAPGGNFDGGVGSASPFPTDQTELNAHPATPVAPEAPTPEQTAPGYSDQSSYRHTLGQSADGIGPALGIDMRGIFLRFAESDVPALNNLDLQVPLGKLTVLLGPNGAGKTTAIRMITGALTPEVGYRRVLGRDPHTQGADIRTRVGVVSAEPALYERLNGWENLRYAAQLYGCDDSDAGIRPAAERFGIEHALDQKVAGYSTGMKTRLTLSRAILNSPELLLLDEPTSGLDPESAKAVLELIAELCRDGITVLMCTHLLSEAEGIADQLVVLDAGRNLVSGTPDELTEWFGPGPLMRITASDPAALVNVLRGTGAAQNLSHPAAATVATRPPVPGVVGEPVLPNSASDPVVVAIEDHSVIPDIVDHLVSSGIRIERVEPVVPTLEELYFSIRSQQRR